MRSIPTLLLALLLAFGAGTATISCSSNGKTVVHEHRQNPDGTTTIVKSEEDHDDDDDDDGCGGILSCTVDGVGFVLALPFKIIGGLISVIF